MLLPMKFRRPAWALLVAVPVMCVGACGGDAGLASSSTYANLCASPRPDTVDRPGSLETEKSFLRSWTDELYLWYAEVPPNDPAQYTSVLDYFAVLKTEAKTASGQPKDRFHFVYTTEHWDMLSQAA